MAFLCALFFMGCVKEVDFDQIDDIEIRSVYIASLAYFDLQADDFLDDNGEELPHIVDFVELQLNPDYAENIEKLEFTFEFSNSFSRDFYAQVHFFDSEGNVIYTLEPAIEVGRNTQGMRTVIVVTQPDVRLVYSAYQAGFFMQVVPDEQHPITPNTPGVVDLKSSLTLYLNLGT